MPVRRPLVISDPAESSVVLDDRDPVTPFGAVDSTDAPVRPEDFDPLTAFDAVDSADTEMVPGVDAPTTPDADPAGIAHAEAPMIPDVDDLTVLGDTARGSEWYLVL